MEQPLKSEATHRATGLLRAWGAGDAAALEQLIPLVHDELRRLARRYMGRERVGNTLQPTALVNEAYLRLVDLRQMRWQDRAHFLAMAARLMRRILVDAARSKGYQKRGGDVRRVSFDQALVVSTHRHNMLSICDRLIVIDAGKIIADGPRDAVLGKLSAASKQQEAGQ